MLAKAPVFTRTTTIRYYLWSTEGPNRIPQKVHQDLIEGEAALPQFAGTSQKILEIFVTHTSGPRFDVKARGIVYPFDARGYLDNKRYLREALPEISRFEKKHKNVLDIEPTLRERRFRSQFTWKPSRSILEEVRSDVAGTGQKIPFLRAFRPKSSKR